MTGLTYAVLKYSFILALILFAWLAVRSLHKDVSAFLPSRDKWLKKRRKQMKEAKGRSSASSTPSTPPSSPASTQTSIVSLVTHTAPSHPIPSSQSDTTVLVIVDGKNAGVTFPLSPFCTVGRAPDNSIVVSDQFISSHHARIYKDKGGEWALEDLGSTNGTYLDEKQIAGPVTIKSGQIIRLGATSFELR